jgi:hypothetical protein
MRNKTKRAICRSQKSKWSRIHEDAEFGKQEETAQLAIENSTKKNPSTRNGKANSLEERGKIKFGNSQKLYWHQKDGKEKPIRNTTKI